MAQEPLLDLSVPVASPHHNKKQAPILHSLIHTLYYHTHFQSIQYYTVPNQERLTGYA